ncbi:MAG TPA: HAMP domain-containing sensor histidine kinase [Ramlibacter sp.]
MHAPCALLAAALAACSLVGWATGAPLLTTFLPGRPSLSPMTAAILLLAAGAVEVLPRRRSGALLLATAEVACGVAIVAAQLMHWPDRLGIPVEWWSSRLTGVAFALSGAASVLLAAGRLVGGQLVAFAVLLFTALLGLGHVFPTADLYAYMPGTGVAIPTVLAFMALSMGQLLSFGDTGVSGALTSRNAAGRAGLRLLLGGLLVALLLAVGVVIVYQRGLFDAETAVLLVAWSAMGLLGGTLWGVAVAVDRAELARAAAERDRDQVRQMVAAAVTHDLRSPLQAAVLSGTLLQRLVADSPALAAVGRLQRSHRRLERLLRSLLDSLAVGSGQQLTFQASRFSLRDLVQEVIAENEGTLAHRVGCDGAAEGWWDRDALFRVIENLLLNAIKYGEPRSPVRCRMAMAGDHAELTVENQGTPIAVGEWESIFEPFSRGEGALDAGHVGWGVGLAYARSVATSHGGSVRVAASGPQGTIFELRLPQDSRPWLERTPTR